MRSNVEARRGSTAGTTTQDFRRSDAGFTLMELMVAVAVVAVLIAIVVPSVGIIVNNHRVKTDQATVSNAKTAAALQYMTDGNKGEKTYFYNGTAALTSADGINGYGLYAKADRAAQIGAAGTPKDNFVMVAVASDGTQTATWVDAAGAAANSVDDDGTVVFKSGTLVVNSSIASGYGGDKSKVKRIVFEQGAVLKDGNASSMFLDYPNLEEIDMSGVTLLTTDYKTFTNCPKLRKITLPAIGRRGDAFNLEGVWYYSDEYQYRCAQQYKGQYGSWFTRLKYGDGANMTLYGRPTRVTIGQGVVLYRGFDGDRPEVLTQQGRDGQYLPATKV